MMSSSNARNYRFPFTASQWQELEHQALIFKYMISGMPIPPDLLYTVRRSLDSSLSSKLLLHQPQHIGWNCFQMGFGRKIDPEPGRCRRTDGKKWRCSKEAYPDSKYCERHMHRGRNRSRKPVEVMTTTTPPPPPSSSTNTSTPIPISSITKNANINPNPSSPTSHSLSCLTSLASEPHNHHNHASYTSTPTALHHHHPFLYPPHSSSRPPPGSDLPSQENTTTNFLLESGPYTHAGKGCYSSYGQVPKEEVDEHVFLSEASGTMRNVSDTSLHDSWQLTMGSPLKHRSYSGAHSGHSSYLQLNDSSRRQKQDHHHYYALGCDDLKNDVHVPLTTMMERGEDHHQQPKKVMHHFFDEWPPKDKDSWIDADDNDNDNNNNSNIKLGRNHQHHHQAPASKIQLSISMPNTSHDFFMTRNGT